jgi:molybdopterin adenylyltransferase
MENRYTAAVITVSDKGFAGLREDTSGPALVKLLREDGYEVIRTSLVPDDMEKIMTELTICADRLSPCLIVTTGGTGFSKRDITPEATKAVIQREVPAYPRPCGPNPCA